VAKNKKGCIEMLPVLNPISYEKPRRKYKSKPVKTRVKMRIFNFQACKK
jgi:hypothetical protein